MHKGVFVPVPSRLCTPSEAGSPSHSASIVSPADSESITGALCPALEETLFIALVMARM